MEDLQNVGSEILDAVSNAVASGNFNNLSASIRRSVNSAITQERDARDRRGSKDAQEAYRYNEHLKGKSASWTRPDTLRTQSAQGSQKTLAQDGTLVAVKSGTQLPDTPYYNQGIRRLSSYTGMAPLALGSVGAGICGLGSVTSLAAGSLLSGFLPGIAGGLSFAAAGLFGIGFVAGLVFAVRGASQRKRYVRYREYGRVIGDADFISVQDLSTLTGIDVPTVLKDIKSLQKDGILPEARLDTNETTLMVTRKAYEQYLAAEKARLQREHEQRALEDNLSGSVYAAQVQQILSDGEDYLRQVRDLNVRIPDAEMTRKISRIEDIMHKTFEEVKQKPEAAPSLRKYMSYYLPTTVKLLNAYADLDSKPDIGENIANTKREISDSLDTVGDGFEKLFDSLFEEMSWDISSDISVMKTMLAQDGLTEHTITSTHTP